VFRIRHPEVTQVRNEALDLLRKAGIVIDNAVLTELGS